MWQEHQLIGVYPDLVAGLEQRDELFGKKLVQLHIGLEILAFVIGQRGEIVKKRPQYGVGKAVVVVVVQLFIDKNGKEVKVLADGMGSDHLIPVLLGKIRYTHPHFLRYIPSLGRRVLEITLYR